MGDKKDEKVDRGDNLTEEQIAAAAAEKENEQSAEDIDNAIAALSDKSKDNKDDKKVDAKDDKDDKSDKKDKGNKGDKGDKDDEPTIPKTRFDEAVGNERSRADKAEQDRDRLQAQIDANKKPDSIDDGPTLDDQINTAAANVLKSRTEWQAAIIDNDAAKASRLLEAMTAAEENLSKLRLHQASQATRQQATEDISFDSLLTELESTYPQINQTNDLYDGNIDRKISRLMNGLIKGGVPRVEALQEAADIYLIPLKSTSDDDKDDPDLKKETEDKLRNKSKETLKKAVSDQAPEGEGKLETKGPTIKPTKLTLKQFSNIPREHLADMRGDTL